jgi:hypothetical protein
MWNSKTQRVERLGVGSDYEIWFRCVCVCVCVLIHTLPPLSLLLLYSLRLLH